MHYAIVTETYPPEVNGVALTVHHLRSGLRARRNTISLIRPRQRHDFLHPDDTLLVRGGALPRYPGLRFGFPATRRLLRHWRGNRPDIVYIATEGPLGWSALTAARQLEIPTISGLHTRFDHYVRDYGAAFLQGPVMRWMRYFHNRADVTLVPTTELAEYLARQGFHNVHRLPRAVDNQRFSPRHRCDALRKQWQATDDNLIVIHVGRIAAEKNLELAVRAFRRIQVERPDARFVWVGDGPARPLLEKKHPDFIFCGTRRGQDLARHFASADLFLFPSLSETFGNVMLEALASGVPTVAFDCAAAREHLHDGIDGRKVGHAEAFLDAAVKLAIDDALRRSMAQAAPEATRHLHPEQVIVDFDALSTALITRNTRYASLAA